MRSRDHEDVPAAEAYGRDSPEKLRGEPTYLQAWLELLSEYRVHAIAGTIHVHVALNITTE